MSDLIGWRHRWIEGKLVHPGGQLERGKMGKDNFAQADLQ
jgi:hypothetical protein